MRRHLLPARRQLQLPGRHHEQRATSGSRSAAARAAGRVPRPGRHITGDCDRCPAKVLPGHARSGHLRHPQQPAGAEAVLDDIEQHRPRRGLVPGRSGRLRRACRTQCTALVADVRSSAWPGNHDLVVRGELDIEHFTRSAGGRRALDDGGDQAPDARLPARPQTARAAASGVGLYHASPRDPVWEYVLSISAGPRVPRACSRERVCLIGHSHVACYFTRDGGETDGEPAHRPAPCSRWREGEWLVNPGSVGPAPRRRPARRLPVLDTGDWTASFRRVEYPIDEAAEAILAAGLPRRPGRAALPGALGPAE